VRLGEWRTAKKREGEEALGRTKSFWGYEGAYFFFSSAPVLSVPLPEPLVSMLLMLMHLCLRGGWAW
jgi:hypothetical protein